MSYINTDISHTSDSYYITYATAADSSSATAADLGIASAADSSITSSADSV